MSEARHLPAGVFDLTAQRWLMRVDEHPRSGEYVCDDAGNYSFAGEDTGHTVIIRYDEQGPKVTRLDLERTQRI